METYNFLAQEPAVPPTNCYIGKYKDLRNGIICNNPTGDLQCYLNYIDFLNLHRNEWISYGYLDLGMIPLAMGPSFMHTQIVGVILESLTKKEVPFYTMPAVSFFRDKCTTIEDDIWVFREDIEKFIGKSNVTTTEAVRWCWI